MSPGLWSSAELEILVVSANIPLLSPIVERVRAKYRTLSERTHKDEERSNILELSAADPHMKGGGSKNASAETSDNGLYTTAEGIGDRGKSHTNTTPPETGILVEMGLEQRVHGL